MCEPALVQLVPDVGALSPTFASDVASYALELPFVYETARLSIQASSGAAVTVDGQGGPPFFTSEGEETIIRVTRERREAVYKLRATRNAFVRGGVANPGRPDTSFGDVIAAQGDVLVVGAPVDASAAKGINGNPNSDCDSASPTNCAPFSGAVYVFRRKDGVWAQEAYLKASNAQRSDAFGRSVALDGPLLVVGAPRESSAASGVNGNQIASCSAPTPSNCAYRSGAAYVFRRTTEGWKQETYLKARTPTPNQELGVSVAISGEQVAVGSSAESSSAAGVQAQQLASDCLAASPQNCAKSSGAVMIYGREAEGWYVDAYVKPPVNSNNSMLNATFGASLALSGNRLLVGAPNSESAHVLRNSAANGWVFEAELKAAVSNEDDFFGAAVALDGTTAVVGAAGHDSDRVDVPADCEAEAPAHCLKSSGAVYVFEPVAGAWVETAGLKTLNLHDNQQLGNPVAISGNVIVAAVSGDSAPIDAAGSLVPDCSAPIPMACDEYNGGAVVFARPEGRTWKQTRYLKGVASGLQEVGFSVAFASGVAFVSATNNAAKDLSVAPDCGASVPVNCAAGLGGVLTFE